MPPKVVWYVALAFAVLGLGGVVLDHFFGGPVDTSAPTTTVATTTTTIASGRPLPVTALSYIGLKLIGPSPAPPISLSDTSGRPWRLSHQLGRVVIVAFYSVDCSDMCPVLGAELREALALMGRPIRSRSRSSTPTPTTSLIEARPAALTKPGLAANPNVAFLTGLARLAERASGRATASRSTSPPRARSCTTTCSTSSTPGVGCARSHSLRRREPRAGGTGCRPPTRRASPRAWPTRPVAWPVTPSPWPEFDPGSMPTSSFSTVKAVWFRRPWVLVTAVVVVIAAISVITDLPHPISRSQDIADQNASLKVINSDLKPCAYGVGEAFRFYRQQAAGTLSAPHRRWP